MRCARPSWLDYSDAGCTVLANALTWWSGMTQAQRESPADVVSIDPEVVHGTPCFTGTRIPVQTLIDFLNTGDSIDDFLSVYLELSKSLIVEQLACAS